MKTYQTIEFYKMSCGRLHSLVGAFRVSDIDALLSAIKEI
jgi:hypothetical protein